MNPESCQYKGFLMNVRVLPLRGSTEWTTHFSVHKDTRDGMTLICNAHVGNRCTDEKEAFDVGLREAERIIDKH